MEGWKQKIEQDTSGKVKENIELKSEMEVTIEPLEVDTEDDILLEVDLKRKAEDRSIPEGRKSKRKKTEPLVGWGLRSGDESGSSLQEDQLVEPGQVTRCTDWVNSSPVMLVKSKQSSMEDWIKDGNLPKGWKPEKVEKKPEKARRIRGKLSKKEVAAMKASHKDIGQMFRTKPSKEPSEHEELIDKETEYLNDDMEKMKKEMEKEERLTRIRRKASE